MSQLKIWLKRKKKYCLQSLSPLVKIINRTYRSTFKSCNFENNLPQEDGYEMDTIV